MKKNMQAPHILENIIAAHKGKPNLRPNDVAGKTTKNPDCQRI